MANTSITPSLPPLPYLLGVASTPADNAAQAGPGPVVVVPPANMIAGDLVVAIVQHQHSGLAELRISEAGGQPWQWAGAAPDDSYGFWPQPPLVGSPDIALRAFWAVFNGTWTANPSFTADTGAEALTVLLLVYRPGDPSRLFWVPDLWQRWAAYAAPAGAPITIAQQEGPKFDGDTAFYTAVNARNPGVILAALASDGLNTYGSPVGYRWVGEASAQYRNTSGVGQSLVCSHKIYGDVGAPGNVSFTQLSGSNQAVSQILSLANVQRPAGGSGSPLAMVQHAFGLMDVPVSSGSPFYFFDFWLDPAAPITTGNSVLLSLNFEDTSGSGTNIRIIDIFDDAGNRYYPVQSVDASTFTQILCAAIGVNLKGSPTRITVRTHAASGYPAGLHYVEVSGSLRLGATSGRAKPSAASAISPGAIPVGLGAFIYAVYRTEGVGYAQPFFNVTAWGGTMIDEQGSATPLLADRSHAWKVMGAAGTLDASATMTTDATVCTLVVALETVP